MAKARNWRAIGIYYYNILSLYWYYYIILYLMVSVYFVCGNCVIVICEIGILYPIVR